MWATVADVQGVIGTADEAMYTPPGTVFADVMQRHLDTAEGTISARLVEGGWAVPVPSITTAAAAWLKAAQIALALQSAQIVRTGTGEPGEDSNVERDAKRYLGALARIAGGAPLADMSPLPLGFEVITTEEEPVSPYDLTAVYQPTR